LIVTLAHASSERRGFLCLSWLMLSHLKILEDEFGLDLEQIGRFVQ